VTRVSERVYGRDSLNWCGLCESQSLMGAGLSVSSRGLVAEGCVSAVVVGLGLPVSDHDSGVGRSRTMARLAPAISRVTVGHGMEEVRGSNPLSSTQCFA